MTGVIRAAADLQRVCEAEGWRYCFIGGLAVLRWGEPRETVDVDLTLLTGFRDESRFIRTLLGWAYVVEHLAPLAELKDAPEIVETLERRREDLRR